MTATTSSTSTRVHVRTATPEDHADVVAALAAAFQTDPVFAWIIPDHTRRAATTRPFFAELTTAIGRHGASLTTGDDSGAALWVPPGEQAVDVADAEAFEARLVEIAGPDAERMGTCVSVLEDSHPHEPHWYLNFLGVAPGLQGCGIGSAMLQHALARVDAEGMPAYLEATSPDNRRLYERHGFVVTREIGLPDGPTLYAMWRDPAPPEGERDGT
jgi:ribosomal protein S18 acetylase RimI-like enzyme